MKYLIHSPHHKGTGIRTQIWESQLVSAIAHGLGALGSTSGNLKLFGAFVSSREFGSQRPH